MWNNEVKDVQSTIDHVYEHPTVASLRSNLIHSHSHGMRGRTKYRGGATITSVGTRKTGGMGPGEGGTSTSCSRMGTFLTIFKVLFTALVHSPNEPR